MVRRLDSCGLGLFLGHAFGDEGAVGRGVVSYWVGRKRTVRREAEKEGKRGERDWGEDMEVIRTRTRSFAPSGVLSCGA